MEAIPFGTRVAGGARHVLRGSGPPRAPSPDAHCAPPGLRSLEDACAAASMPPLAIYAGSQGTGSPSRLNARAAVRLAGLRPLGINPALRAWHAHKKPRVETRERDAREPAASCRGSLGGPAPAWNQPGPPGLARTQEAPGGNPGTPGMKTVPSSMPPDAMRFPGSNPIAHGTREGMRPGVPRLPPGASCAVRAWQAESKTGERATSKGARHSSCPGLPVCDAQIPCRTGLPWRALSTDS